MNDRNAISDLFAAGNEGANGKRIVQCNANTLNTPYKAGLTDGASGTAYLNISSATYGTILYIASGSNRMFLACKAGGAWGDWIEVVTNADIVFLSGVDQVQFDCVNQAEYIKVVSNGIIYQLTADPTGIHYDKCENNVWSNIWHITN